MDRRSGFLRTIRRQWSPYRIYSDSINDRIYSQAGVQRNTQVEVLDKYYFFLADDTTNVEAVFPYPGLITFGGVSVPDTESHRIYRIYRDLDRVNEVGERIWDGSTLAVSTWSVSSYYHPTYLRFHDTFVLTKGNNIQNLVAQNNRNGGPFIGDSSSPLTTAKPWVNGSITLATTLAASGSWAGSTNVLIMETDRPQQSRDEYVIYVWRGYGGQRPDNPILRDQIQPSDITRVLLLSRFGQRP
jgi:hypothetical protein